MTPKATKSDDVMPPVCRAAAEMARLLEYNSDEERYSSNGEDGSHELDPKEPILHVRRRTLGGVSESSTDEEPINWGAGPELGSITLLNHLGANPPETMMAKVAMTRAQESINDCFSYNGVDAVDRSKFDDILSYRKDEILMGRHLGKGSFSDVFEVTVIRSDHQLNAEIDVVSSQEVEGSTSANENGRRRTSQRRHSMSSSVCVGSLGRPQVDSFESKRMTLAMKCLRPQARSNFEHFLVGVEDLIHETAILSSLDHPNIIKLWGRSGDSTSFKLDDGYFILVDLLRDTLNDRIDRWVKDYPNARKNAPSLHQMKVACDLAGALSYLHMNNIVFRDLKPANVGFNSSGTLKLFDFGFAKRLGNESGDSGDEPQVLYDMCGTLRYMAREGELLYMSH
jgi:hypothetical protein